MKYIIFCFLLVSCGATIKVKGGSQHVVSGTTTQEVVLKVDISGCMELPEDDRLDCIEAITDALKGITDAAKILLCTKDFESQSGIPGADTPESCRGLIPVEDDGSGS